MFSFARSMEVFFFSLFNFAPYILLSYYIFRKHFRYSNKVVKFACVFLFLTQFGIRYFSAFHGINTNFLIGAIRLFIFIVTYAILFDQRLGKVLFIGLIFTNLENMILIGAICLERNLFPNIEHKLYCWHTTIIMIVLHLIITLPWALEARKYLLPMLDNHWIKKEWNYYWVVPTVFFIIWQYQINGGARTGLENIQDARNVFFVFLINFGSLFIYYLMLRLDGQLAKNLMLEEEKHVHDLELLAFQSLQERMEETRRIRHDLKHHVHMVNYYLEQKEYDKLQEYVNVFHNSIPDGDRIQFCENRVINNIVFYFASQARTHEIDFDVHLDIAESLPVKELDISILLGNLFENALESCLSQHSSRRRIIVKGKADDYSLVFTIDNTFENEIKKNEAGDFVTTKKNGQGIGLKSVKKIVERYKGAFSAEQKENMFCVSFMLNL